VTLDDYLTARSRVDVACAQNAYNVTGRSDQPLFDACRANGVPFVPFFPLGSAFWPENPVLLAPAVLNAASRLGATPAPVALGWLLAQAPTVLLIPGTSSLVHLEENLAAPSGPRRADHGVPRPGHRLTAAPPLCDIHAIISQVFSKAVPRAGR
jgi:pyridoxine 4-dehydrogenase